MDDFDKIKQSIIDEVKSLPKDSESVSPHIADIETALNPNFWNTRGLDPLIFLKKKIMPLMKYKPGVSLKPASFVYKCEQLLLVKLELDHISEWWEQEGPKKLIDEICASLTKIPDSIEEIADKRQLIETMLTEKNFWDDITIEKICQIRDELSPVMVYQQSEPVQTILIRMDDVIQQRDTIRYGPERESVDSQIYIEKVEKKIRELAESNPVILKIKNDEQITQADIESLADTLNSSELGITDKTLSKAYNTPKRDIVEFIRHILGLVKLSNKEDMIGEAFAGFLLSKKFNPEQINFIRILEALFLSKRNIEYVDFFNLPFSNMGKSATSFFEKEELLEMVKFCKILERGVNE